MNTPDQEWKNHAMMLPAFIGEQSETMCEHLDSSGIPRMRDSGWVVGFAVISRRRNGGWTLVRPRCANAESAVNQAARPAA
ncbi:MAG TPA: hypothetical protein PKC67_01015 [Kiritimatiellia bacterium]|nr:hypothetical protein [Kiritimatiellia bacterium]HMP32901.1 hypothetical protein [Kiritimatiellia bacterium]